MTGGLAIKFVMLPLQAKFPADVDTTRVYDGDLAVMMNAAVLETGDLANLFLTDIPVTIDRTVKTVAVERRWMPSRTSPVTIGPLLAKDS